MSLFTVIQSHINKLKDTLYTNSVGEIVAINGTNSITSVDVRPSVNRLYNDGEERQKPTIYNVPVVFPSGGGGIISFPLKVGDTVLLIFGREDISNFLKDKRLGRPATQRKFSINDAIAIPCLNPFNDTLEPSKDNVEIKYKGSTVRIDSEGNVAVESQSKVSVDAVGEVRVKSPTLLLDCPEVTITGTLSVAGNVSTQGSLSTQGDISTEGSISTEGDISTSAIPSINTHKHGLIQKGTSTSGVPLP